MNNFSRIYAPLFSSLGFLVTSLSGQAGIIAWGSATSLADSSDVSTSGSLVEAYNCVANDQIAAATDLIVNGVTFIPTTSLLDSDPRNGGTLDFSTTTNGGDAAYDSLVSTLEFGGGTNLVTLTVGDGDGDGSVTGPGLLVAGALYEIQVWYSDTRFTNPATDRTTPVGDGNGNTVDLNDQFAIGTFTADGDTQNITLDSPGFGQAHINAYQIRLLTLDPAPAVDLTTVADVVADPYTINVAFSEDVTGLTETDFSVINGTASAVFPATGPASVYTVTITPSASGAVSVSLPAATVQDNTANPNFVSNTLSTLHIPIGSAQATPTLFTSALAPVSAAYDVEITFDEDVTGLDASDFTVLRGIASNVLPAIGPASVYTVTITPTVDGFVNVTLPSQTTLDVNDNLPNLASNTLSTAHIAPPVFSSTLSNPVTGSIVSSAYTIEVSFPQDVTGLDVSDFVLTNGTASNLTPVGGSAQLYTLDITPTAIGLVSVFLPANSVIALNGGDLDSDSRPLYANNLPAGTITSGTIDLSGRDFAGLGIGESNGTFANPKTFDAVSDLSMNDIPWTDGVNSGTFDLSFVATSTLGGITRGGRGAFGSGSGTGGSALINDGSSIVLDSLVISDLQGDLANASITNIEFLAIYLGNQIDGDSATINNLVVGGSPGGVTLDEMRNDIERSPSATITGTGGGGFSVNAIAITFDLTFSAIFAQIVTAQFDVNNQFVVTAAGLDTNTSYELRYSPDLQTPFIPIPGTSGIPATTTDTFIDPSPPLPGKRFYQIWTTQ